MEMFWYFFALWAVGWAVVLAGGMAAFKSSSRRLSTDKHWAAHQEYWRRQRRLDAWLVLLSWAWPLGVPALAVFALWKLCAGLWSLLRGGSEVVRAAFGRE